MDWILFEKRGMDCVCNATTGHVNMFFFPEEAICRVPSSAYESMFKNRTQFMFSAGSVVLRFAAPLSCVALESVKLKCPSDLVQTLIFFIIAGCKSSLHGG